MKLPFKCSMKTARRLNRNPICGCIDPAAMDLGSYSTSTIHLGREHPRKFPQGFKNYLVTDGYAYNGIPDANNAGCWSHARSGLDKAVKAAGKTKNPKPWTGLNFVTSSFPLKKSLSTTNPKNGMKSDFCRANLY